MQVGGLLAAGSVAALLTVFDLDKTFYIPNAAPRKAALRAWQTTFILANAALAMGLFLVLDDTQPFSGWPAYGSGIAIGLGYLALIRAKFTTFTFSGKEVPFGFELAYEGAKGFIYRRINRIAKTARYEEADDLASTLALAGLVQRARLSIDQDALMNSDDKKAAKAWLLAVLEDASADDMGKRLLLANFILSGQLADA